MKPHRNKNLDYADPEAACSLLGPTYFDIFSVGSANPKPSVRYFSKSLI